VTYDCLFQAFINTAKEIYQKIQEGVFDINNEVCMLLGISLPVTTLVIIIVAFIYTDYMHV